MTRNSEGSTPAALIHSFSLGTLGHRVVKGRATGDLLVVISAFAAAICWWIGVTGLVAIGGMAGGTAGFVVFLAIPVLVTVTTYRVVRRRRSPTSP